MEERQNMGATPSGPNGEDEYAPSAATAADAQPESEGTRPNQMDELTRAYERARDELNEAVRNLRAELAKIDIEQARARARSWVDENPTLAVLLGVGAGILTGRLLANAFRSEPPSVTERARNRADALVGDAGTTANEIIAALAYYLGRAARSAGDAGEFVTSRGSDLAANLSRQAVRVGEDVSRKAERAGKEFSRQAGHLGRDISRKAEHAADTIADSTARSVHALEEAADDLSKTLKKRSKKIKKKIRKHDSSDFSEMAMNAARTIVAAAAVKKANDWIKRMR